MIQCPKCGIGQNIAASFCSVCGSVLNQKPQKAISTLTLNEWENREGSLFVALWKTATSVITSPSTFFKQISPRSKMGSAVLFFTLLTLLAIPATMLTQSQELTGSSAAQIAQIFFEPIAMIIFGIAGIFISSGFLQLLFMITRVKKASYRETTIVYAYTNAPILLMIIPIPYLPVIVAGVWIFILQIIGMAKVHQCSTGKMALIQIIPIAILTILFTILIAMIVVLALAIGFSIPESFKIQDILDMIR